MDKLTAKVKFGPNPHGTMKLDDTPLDAGIVALFSVIMDPQRRQGVLKKLHAVDERLNAPKSEATP